MSHHLRQPVWMWGSRCLSQQHATSTDSHCQLKWGSVAWDSMVHNCFSPPWKWPLCWWGLQSNQEGGRFPSLPQKHGERRDVSSLREGAPSARADTKTGGMCWDFKAKICSQGRSRLDCLQSLNKRTYGQMLDMDKQYKAIGLQKALPTGAKKKKSENPSN